MTTKETYKKSQILSTIPGHPRCEDSLKPIPQNSRMSLASLKVVGPISTLVTTVRVQGQSLGSEVFVLSLTDQQVKASGLATHVDQRFGLLPDIFLNPNDRLVAIQTLGCDASELPSEYQSVSVQQAPISQADIGKVKIESYSCFQGESYLWVSGNIPGAVVEAYFDGKIQGRSISEEGIARLTLADTPPIGITISIYQAVKGVGSGPVSNITPEPKFSLFSGKRDSYQYSLLAN